MLKNIQQFFEKHFKGIEAAEENKVDALHLASAAIMIELCKSDQSIDETETQKLASILESKFSLKHEEVQELISLAQQEAEEATSLYQFTGLFNDHFTYEDRLVLISNLWEIAFADGNIDRHEDYLIRKVADLLHLTHGDFMRCKLKVKAQLDV